MDEDVKEEMPQLQQLIRGQEPISDIEVKLQLLHLAKDVIQQNAAMRWETHKRCEEINVDMIIKEARKLLRFINK